MIEHILRAIEDLPALDRADAAQLTDLIFDQVIDTLRRDSSVLPRSFASWTIFFAPIRDRASEQIHRRVHGRVTRDEVVCAIEDASCALGGEEP